MNHYIYNKEGIKQAMGLSSLKLVKYHKNQAIKAGRDPCKMIGGVEMYDLEIMQSKYKQKSWSNQYTEEDLNVFATGRLFAS